MKKKVTVRPDIITFLIVTFCLLGIIGKLIYVSLSSKVDGKDLKLLASKRYTKTKTLHASRGNIYDHNGEVLALSVNSYDLIAYVNPKRTTNINKPNHVVDKEKTARLLSPIIGMSEADILEQLNKNLVNENLYQVEFGSKGKGLTEKVRKQIELLNLPGIDFIEGTKRYYKMGDFASYIIGYAKKGEDNQIKGELGIESYFNNELSGEDGYIKYESDARGYKLPYSKEMKVPAKKGEDIYLTIDSNIELITKNALGTLSKNYNFDWAIMSVLDAKTGEIVASSTYPSFDPNNLNTLKDYLNPLVSYAYEPGSTMKIFSWSAAMEDGSYNGNATFESGSIPVADVVISDANRKGWGTITYDKGFAYSSNVGASRLALSIGAEKLTHQYDLFGFGKKTGIELSGELEGTVNIRYKSELANAAFGQGLTVTPIQLMQAVTSICNDGIMLKPYIVKRIIDENDNITYEGARSEVGRVISKQTADKMKKLMYSANYEGLSTYWRPNTVTMLMKTGTAQLVVNGEYSKGLYDTIYSIVGIFPEDNPRYIIYSAVQRIAGPQRGFANVVTKAVDEIASYANITKTNNIEGKTQIIKLKNYISKNVNDTVNELNQINLKPIVIGNGSYVINQYPNQKSKLVPNTKVFIITNSKEVIIPNMIGWSYSEVKSFVTIAGIQYQINGSGYVTNQSISENTIYDKNSVLEITLN
ncbi:MAG: penicillin-binding protein [Mollicutes bacterium]|nr:penicillin-binding protein [Mollicutes bacterium]